MKSSSPSDTETNESGPESNAESTTDTSQPVPSRTLQLAKHAAFHLTLWLGAFSAFAAADSWSLLSGLAIACFLSVVTAIVAGLVTSNIIHEWFHLLGAWRSGGIYTIPDKLGLFVYDWKFALNNTEQFRIMSIAGTVGSVLAIVLVWLALPTDTVGRTALIATTIGSLAFAGNIEWPVLKRTGISGDPLAELSKIDLNVLKRSFAIGVGVGLIAWLLL